MIVALDNRRYSCYTNSILIKKVFAYEKHTHQYPPLERHRFNDVTLLVSSCDKYEDAWHPFFELLHIYGNGFSCPIVLNTETKNYVNEHFDIRVINSPGKMTWSERMANVLSQIDTEFVLLILDDYFLKDHFGTERFDKVLNYMRAHKDVGFVDIAPRWAASGEDVKNNLQNNDIQDDFYVRENDEWNITLVPSVWRKDFFLNLLRKHEDVWMFEYYSGIRAKKTGMKVVRFVTRMPTIYEYDFQVWTGMGITRGQWLPQNVDFFNRHGIDVNFANLGILNVASSEEIKAMNKRSFASILNGVKRRIYWRITRSKSLN